MPLPGRTINLMHLWIATSSIKINSILEKAKKHLRVHNFVVGAVGPNYRHVQKQIIEDNNIVRQKLVQFTERKTMYTSTAVIVG